MVSFYCEIEESDYLNLVTAANSNGGDFEEFVRNIVLQAIAAGQANAGK